jgi:LDH2 family malate/lactate/ureidoglycolate dehydrogenase
VGAFFPLDQYKRRIDGLIREIRQAPKAKGQERIWLPGEKEWEARQRALEQGIDLPADVRDSLAGLVTDLGLTAPTWL